jgi:hypothetical protein
MFGRTPKVVNTKLDEVIDRIMQEMDNVGPYSPEYPKLIGHLQRTLALRKSEDKQRVSSDTMAIVLGNLFGILIIVSYEHIHVVTTKALSFILKPK